MKTLHASLKEAQCFCKSYYDDNNQLRDCTCGNCEAKSMTHTTTEYIEGKIKELKPFVANILADIDYEQNVESDVLNANVSLVLQQFRSFAHDLVAETRKECLREVGEMIGKMKQLPYYAQPAQNRNGINYCSTCEQAWEDCSCSARNTGYKKALSDVLADLQEKLKGAL